MPIDFRPCTPEDQHDMVPLIYSSGPKTFDYVFSLDYPSQSEDFLHYAYQCDEGQFSYSEHTAMTFEGDIVAGGCITSGEQLNKHMWSNVKQIFAFYGVIKGIKVMRRGLRVERVIPPPKNEIAYICNLGAAVKGKGYGSQLIEEFEQTARDALHDVIALDVADSNTHARRLYDRLDYVADTYRPAYEEGRWGRLEGHTYMEKSL